MFSILLSPSAVELPERRTDSQHTLHTSLQEWGRFAFTLSAVEELRKHRHNSSLGASWIANPELGRWKTNIRNRFSTCPLGAWPLFKNVDVSQREVSVLPHFLLNFPWTWYEMRCLSVPSLALSLHVVVTEDLIH